MTAAPTDRRLTPATERVALEVLRDVIVRPAYTPGRPAHLVVPVADLCRAPAGARDRQLNFGADLTLIDQADGWVFIQAALDGYCGWIRAEQAREITAPVTHRVTASATHVYSGPNLKTADIISLSMGARLSVTGWDNGFAELAQGGWVPSQHIAEQPESDPAAVAERLIGTPYLWGGNSRWGIDCSGMVQAALAACAVHCPGDSDLQEKAFAPVSGDIRRNDLLFWPGHVAMALDGDRMIHATAFAMAVIIEPIKAAIARIDASGQGPFRGARRPVLAAADRFP